MSPKPPAERPALELPDAAPLPVPAFFAERAKALGAPLDGPRTERLARYLGLLLGMNERMNLTAITAPDEAWEKHALDALSLVPLVADLPRGARVADVGSGGGVPALPLAIARPDLAYTLFESTQKKASFLRSCAQALGLGTVRVLAERAEQAAAGAERGRFDAVTARGVGRLAALVPLTAPLLRDGGLALFIKGQRADEELEEAQREGVLRRYRVAHERTVATPTGRVVLLRRAAETPRA